MEEDNLYNYAESVPRVLLQSNQLFGIGLIPAMLIVVLTIVLMNMVSIWCVSVGLILFIAAKIVTRKDKDMLKIVIERILHPSVWRCS